MIFEICALPRSGTAWLATMFNLCPSCIAFHELAATEPAWREKLGLATLANKHVGHVNTHGFLPRGGINANARVLILQPAEKSLERSEKAFGVPLDIQSYRNLLQMAQRWAYTNRALTVSNDDLFRSVLVAKRIWHYCLPDEPFPQDKVELLLGMNVQRHEPRRVFDPKRMSAVISEML